MVKRLKLVHSPALPLIYERLLTFVGIVGPPADHLLGYEGVEGAQGPRFRKLTPHEIEDYLTNL
jgi:hypothetical protein